MSKKKDQIEEEVQSEELANTGRIIEGETIINEKAGKGKIKVSDDWYDPSGDSEERSYAEAFNEHGHKQTSEAKEETPPSGYVEPESYEHEDADPFTDVDTGTDETT